MRALKFLAMLKYIYNMYISTAPIYFYNIKPAPINAFVLRNKHWDA